MRTPPGAPSLGTPGARMYLRHKGKSQNYTSPSSACLQPLNLNIGNITDIIGDEIKQGVWAKPDDVVEVILFFGMQRAFPCKK